MDFSRQKGKRIIGTTSLAKPVIFGSSQCVHNPLLCRTCADLGEFRVYFVGNESLRHVGVYVGYWPQRNLALTVFRGTIYLTNWIEDLQFLKVDSKYEACDASLSDARGLETTLQEEEVEFGSKRRKGRRRCMVHSGFYDDWKSVQDDVYHAIDQILADHPSAEVWVTGHSLGGALAALCALALRTSHLPPSSHVGLYTFGQPRVGNVDFAQFFSEKLPGAIRVVHQDDVVPHLPPKSNMVITNFHHHSTEVWQHGPKDDIFQVCDGSGEDPHCSNSLPEWDRSVAAHKLYVHLHMSCEPRAGPGAEEGEA
mmetsp:Transcript_44241/g.90288  ORF Transcript_44241/g.90288 Transcript_44241/m.90288 type:complete len:311 (-) Transcript_44241:194-1126(-)